MIAGGGGVLGAALGRAGAAAAATGAVDVATRRGSAGQGGATAVRGRIVVVQPGAVSSFEPDGPAFVNALQVVSNAYDGLTEVSMPADLQTAAAELRTKGLPALPALAASWESDAKRVVWRFRLRPGVVSALGNPLTSADVLFSVQKWLGQQFIAKLLLGLGNVGSADQVKALGPLTVQFRLNAPAPPWFLDLFALGFMAIYDSVELRKRVTAADPYGQMFTHAATAGFGPYALQSVSPSGDQALLVANPFYYRGAPPIKSWIRQAVDDDGQRLQLLLSKNADYTDQLTAIQYDQVARSKNWKVVTFTSTRGLFLGMDNTRAPFDDPAVRRGLAQAVPYEDIIAFVHRNRAARWKSVLRSYFPGSTDEFWKYDTDYAAARTALAALIAAKTPVTLSYPVGSGAGEGTAILVQSSLKSIGVNLVLDGLSASFYNQRRISGDLAFFTDELDAPVISDAHYELNQLYTSKAAQPRLIKFRETALVDPLSAQLAVLDPQRNAKRYSELLRQAQALIVPLMPIIPISLTGTPTAMTKQLDTRGLLAHQGSFVRFSELTLRG